MSVIKHPNEETIFKLRPNNCFKDVFPLLIYSLLWQSTYFLKYLFKVLTYLWQSTYLSLFLHGSLNVSRILDQNLLSFTKGWQYCFPKLFRALFSSNSIHACSLILKDNTYHCSFSCSYKKTRKRYRKLKVPSKISEINGIAEGSFSKIVWHPRKCPKVTSVDVFIENVGYTFMFYQHIHFFDLKSMKKEIFEIQQVWRLHQDNHFLSLRA